MPLLRLQVCSETGYGRGALKVVRFLRLFFKIGLIPPLIVILFYVASFVGALLPANISYPDARDDGHGVNILLASGPIHYDLLLPATLETRAKLQMLQQSGFDPFDPRIGYFSVGWGSKAFYTSTKDYTDLSAKTIYRAVTGDASVMRIFALGRGLAISDLDQIELPQKQYNALLTYVEQSFLRDSQGHASLLQNTSLRIGDMFFDSPARFNIIKTCNIWIANGLAAAGVKIGRWTPTPQSLRLSLWWFGSLVDAKTSKEYEHG